MCVLCVFVYMCVCDADRVMKQTVNDCHELTGLKEKLVGVKAGRVTGGAVRTTWY